MFNTDNNNNDVYKEILLEHGLKPKNNVALKKKNYVREAHNKLCGDNIKLFLFLQNNKIQNISFKGSGCVISIASASIMTVFLKKKNITDALKTFRFFVAALANKKNSKHNLSSDFDPLLNIKLLPSRVKCATLCWLALQNAILDYIKVHKKNTDSRS